MFKFRLVLFSCIFAVGCSDIPYQTGPNSDGENSDAVNPSGGDNPSVDSTEEPEMQVDPPEPNPEIEDSNRSSRPLDREEMAALLKESWRTKKDLETNRRSQSAEESVRRLNRLRELAKDKSEEAQRLLREIAISGDKVLAAEAQRLLGEIAGMVPATPKPARPGRRSENNVSVRPGTPEKEIGEAQAREVAAANDFSSAVVASNGDHDRAFFLLVENNKADAIRLAKRKGVNINQVNSNKLRPLSVAIRKDNPEAMIALLEEGAEVNYLDRSSPVGWAVSRDRAHLLEPLVRAGADLNFNPKPYSIDLPVHLAVHYDHLTSLVELLRLGAGKNIIGNNSTPLMVAAKDCRARAMQILLEAGADPYLQGGLHMRRNTFELVDRPWNRKCDYTEIKKVLAPYR